MARENELLHEIIALVYLDQQTSTFRDKFFTITGTTIDLFDGYHYENHSNLDTRGQRRQCFNYSFPCGELNEPNSSLNVLLESNIIELESLTGRDIIEIDIESLDMPLLNNLYHTFHSILYL